ncbi:Nicotianamine synthase [Acaromyces ingoldii]|uniref:Nicotianamine synthase n=1 Tax=Acaromyces ingoldii TaxID=215250 RepID=A0A316YI73_9BASI|nr:Nicotianamine synthase [Acaromyces ingoldii]PWN88871.1 Nicotianamine synthase [Acaromyces ingoldii]
MAVRTSGLYSPATVVVAEEDSLVCAQEGLSKEASSATLGSSSIGVVHFCARSTVLDLHRELQGLESLAPCEATDSFFCRLVDFVISPIHGDISPQDLFRALESDERIAAIKHHFVRACSLGEGELESHWARRIIDGKTSIDQFPYYQNYIDLTRLEYHLLVGQGADPRHILFLGSGALPLSGLMWVKNHLCPRWTMASDWSVTNVDVLPSASFSAAAVSRIALQDTDPSLQRFHFVTTDAHHLDAGLVYSHDVIYLAALVGCDMKTKASVLRSVIAKMKPGARLMIRSADGMRQLLYPAVDEAALLCAAEGKLVLEATCHPRNHVVNSVVVARRV